MRKCAGCNKDFPENELCPRYQYSGDLQKLTGTSWLCSRCLSLRAPDALHPEIIREQVPDVWLNAFTDGELDLSTSNPPSAPASYADDIYQD